MAALNRESYDDGEQIIKVIGKGTIPPRFPDEANASFRYDS